MLLHVALLTGWLTAPLAYFFPPRSPFAWNDVEGDVVLPTEVELLEPETPSAKLSVQGSSLEPSAAGQGLDAGIADAGSDGGGPDAGPDGGPDAGTADAGIVDAGVADAAPHDAGPVDAGALDAGKAPEPPKPKEKPAVKDTSEATPKDPARLKDPLVFSGKAGALAGKSPNVSVMVLPESFRKHPSAPKLGALLGKLSQWKAFLQGTGIDPIADVDRLLVAGPQMKQSGKIAAVIKHRWSDAKMREALDGLREKQGGAWEDGSPPTLRTTLDGATRFIVMLPGNVVVVVPEEALAQARAMKGGGFPPAHGEAFLFTLKSPANAMRGLPFTVPTSLESVRLSVTMRKDGGADISFDGTCTSAAAAEIAGDLLTKGFEAATTQKTFLGTLRVFDPVTFAPEGVHVRASMSLHAGQVAKAIEIVGQPIEVQ